MLKQTPEGRQYGYNGPTSNEIAYELTMLRKLLTDRLNDFKGI